MAGSPVLSSHGTVRPMDARKRAFLEHSLSCETLLPDQHLDSNNPPAVPASHLYRRLALLQHFGGPHATGLVTLLANAPEFAYFAEPVGSDGVPRGRTGKRAGPHPKRAKARRADIAACPGLAPTRPNELGYPKAAALRSARRATRAALTRDLRNLAFARHLGDALALLFTGCFPAVVLARGEVGDDLVRTSFHDAVERLGGPAQLARTVVAADKDANLSLAALRAARCAVLSVMPGVASATPGHTRVDDMVTSCAIAAAAPLREVSPIEFVCVAEGATTMTELLEGAGLLGGPADGTPAVRALRRLAADFRVACQSRELPPVMELCRAICKRPAPDHRIPAADGVMYAKIFRTVVDSHPVSDSAGAVAEALRLMVRHLRVPAADVYPVVEVLHHVHNGGPSHSKIKGAMRSFAQASPRASQMLWMLADVWFAGAFTIRATPRAWAQRALVGSDFRYGGIRLPLDHCLTGCAVCNSPRSAISNGGTAEGLTKYLRVFGGGFVCAGNGSVRRTLADGRHCPKAELFHSPIGFTVTMHTESAGRQVTGHCAQPLCGRRMVHERERALYTAFGPCCDLCREHLIGSHIIAALRDLRPLLFEHRGHAPQTCVVCDASVAPAAEGILEAVRRAAHYGRKTAAYAGHGGSGVCGPCHRRLWSRVRSTATAIAPAVLSDTDIYNLIRTNDPRAFLERLLVM